MVGAFGITTLTRDAFTAGAVPDPLVDLVDWYLHKNIYVRGAATDMTRWSFDLRTGRVIRGFGRTMAFVLDVSAASSSSFEFSVSARLLLAV